MGSRTKKKKDVPFFMNSARLNTAESYFKDNYRPVELLKMDLNSDLEDTELETFAADGFYGIPRYMSLKTGRDEEEINFEDDEDEIYDRNVNRWMGFGLAWLTIKRAFTSVRSKLWKRKYAVKDVEAELGTSEIEGLRIEGLPPSEPNPTFNNQIQRSQIISWNEMGEISLADPQDMCKIYEGDLGAVEQFRITTPDGRFANVVQFSVGMGKSILKNATDDEVDLQTSVLSQNCASLMWVQNDKSCIILITESSDPNCWSVQQWFRRILSDMALTDSIMIGHPYYWHPVVRRKLRRAVRYFKKLYKTISTRKEAAKRSSMMFAGDRQRENDNLELACSRGISQVTIAEGPSNCKENQSITSDFIMDLYDKWDVYKDLVDNSKFPTLSRVSDTYLTKYSGSPCGSRAQSTTFLNFSENALTFEPEDVAKIETLNELKRISSGKLHFMSNLKKENLEVETTISDIYGGRSLESKWNDETFNNALKVPNTKSTPELDICNNPRFKVSRPRKLRE